MKLPLRTKARYDEQAVYLLDALEIPLARARYGSAAEDALAQIAGKANANKQSAEEVRAAVERAGCEWELRDTEPAAAPAH